MGGFDLCIKCDQGGKLLVCNDEDCPIVIHEKCLGCPARSDHLGKFYCPYCLSREAYAQLNNAKEYVALTKKSLSLFLGSNKRKDISQSAGTAAEASLTKPNPIDQPDSLRKLPSSFQSNTPTPGDNLTREDPCQFHDTATAVEDQLYTKLDHHSRGSPSVHEKPTDKENESRENNCHETANLNENNSVSDIPSEVHGGGETSNKLSNQHKPVLRKRVKLDSPCEPPSSNVDRFGRSSPVKRKSPRKTEETISPSRHNSPCPSKPLPSDVDCSGKPSPICKSPRKTKQTKAPVKVRQKILFPSARRKRLLWTEEEEEIIKKGVEKFASEDGTSIPWKQILEFGQGTFHRSRMPGDLKDKWRNMLAKEKLAK